MAAHRSFWSGSVLLCPAVPVSSPPLTGISLQLYSSSAWTSGLARSPHFRALLLSTWPAPCWDCGDIGAGCPLVSGFVPPLQLGPVHLLGAAHEGRTQPQPLDPRALPAPEGSTGPPRGHLCLLALPPRLLARPGPPGAGQLSVAVGPAQGAWCHHP